MRIAGVFLAATMMATGASAATMQAVYTGTTNGGGYDTTGYFGLGSLPVQGMNTPLIGKSFTLTVQYDTSLGNLTTYPGLGEALTGGSSSNVLSPIVFASFTMNGITAMFSGATNGRVTAFDSSLDSSFSTFGNQRTYDPVTQYQSTASFQTTILDLPGVLPTSVTSPFRWQPGSQFMFSYGFGDIVFSAYDGLTGQTVLDTSIGFNITDASIAFVSPAAVPLPASALLLVTAVAGMAGVRRRKRAA
jgi:hypothetical protein